jgi:hypothetical protein
VNHGHIAEARIERLETQILGLRAKYRHLGSYLSSTFAQGSIQRLVSLTGGTLGRDSGF